MADNFHDRPSTTCTNVPQPAVADGIVTRLTEPTAGVTSDQWYVMRQTMSEAAAEIERLRRDGDFLLHALQWAMQGRFIPEDMADVMDSWQEARRG